MKHQYDIQKAGAFTRNQTYISGMRKGREITERTKNINLKEPNKGDAKGTILGTNQYPKMRGRMYEKPLFEKRGRTIEASGKAPEYKNEYVRPKKKPLFPYRPETITPYGDGLFGESKYVNEFEHFKNPNNIKVYQYAPLMTVKGQSMWPMNQTELKKAWTKALRIDPSIAGIGKKSNGGGSAQTTQAPADSAPDTTGQATTTPTPTPGQPVPTPGQPVPTPTPTPGQPTPTPGQPVPTPTPTPGQPTPTTAQDQTAGLLAGQTVSTNDIKIGDITNKTIEKLMNEPATEEKQQKINKMISVIKAKEPGRTNQLTKLNNALGKVNRELMDQKKKADDIKAKRAAEEAEKAKKEADEKAKNDAEEAEKARKEAEEKTAEIDKNVKRIEKMIVDLSNKHNFRIRDGQALAQSLEHIFHEKLDEDDETNKAKQIDKIKEKIKEYHKDDINKQTITVSEEAKQRLPYKALKQATQGNQSKPDETPEEEEDKKTPEEIRQEQEKAIRRQKYGKELEDIKKNIKSMKVFSGGDVIFAGTLDTPANLANRYSDFNKLEKEFGTGEYEISEANLKKWKDEIKKRDEETKKREEIKKISQKIADDMVNKIFEELQKKKEAKSSIIKQDLTKPLTEEEKKEIEAELPGTVSFDDDEKETPEEQIKKLIDLLNNHLHGKKQTETKKIQKIINILEGNGGNKYVAHIQQDNAKHFIDQMLPASEGSALDKEEREKYYKLVDKYIKH